jgi:hypothetical protein
MSYQAFGVSGLILLIMGCIAGGDREFDGDADQGGEPSTSIKFSDFDGTSIPRNRAGDAYPGVYEGEGSMGVASLFGGDVVAGKSLRVDVSRKGLYLQWNPYDAVGRGFARDYAIGSGKWRFNAYNRFRFWVKRPTSAAPLGEEGRANVEVGTYVKHVAGADPRSDETGGSHYYHMLNLPNNGRWTRVILNMHPDHRRGDSGNVDAGYLPHPTGEPSYNYFDALTRFYIDDTAAPAVGVYLIDEMEFYQEKARENDAQVYSLTGTYDPGNNEVIVTWKRPKDENDVAHEVRYAFDDVHTIGWAAATRVRGGVVKPPGWQGYNGMVFKSTLLPLAGRSTVFIGIKPSNSKLFSQIAIPLDRAAPPPRNL